MFLRDEFPAQKEVPNISTRDSSLYGFLLRRFGRTARPFPLIFRVVRGEWRFTQSVSVWRSCICEKPKTWSEQPIHEVRIHTTQNPGPRNSEASLCLEGSSPLEHKRRLESNPIIFPISESCACSRNETPNSGEPTKSDLE